MRIAGLEKTSFVDWPGRIAAVLFTPGCNLDCVYCHNRTLLGAGQPGKGLELEFVLDWLESRRRVLDGVVVTGGEPTLQRGLPGFIGAVHALGYPVKLDTNGTRPEVVRALIDAAQVDYVAMDVKAPLDQYDAVCGVPVDHRAINASIDLLLAGRAGYEFRTTVLPQFTHDSLRAIARRVRGAQRLVLQRYRPHDAAAPRPLLPANPAHTGEWIQSILPQLREIVAAVDTRGFDLFPASGAVAL